MPTDEESPDVLVPDVQVQQEFGVSRMTLVRWDKDQTLGFPVKIKIRQHNFRSRRALEKFKQQMFERAIADRNGRRASVANAPGLERVQPTAARATTRSPRHIARRRRQLRDREQA
jgi:hypothetical protein